jgi:hypothetical protein
VEKFGSDGVSVDPTEGVIACSTTDIMRKKNEIPADSIQLTFLEVALMLALRRSKIKRIAAEVEKWVLDDRGKIYQTQVSDFKEWLHSMQKIDFDSCDGPRNSSGNSVVLSNLPMTSGISGDVRGS